MAGNRDYEITLRLKAEINQTLKALDQTKAKVREVGQATAKANADIARSGGGGGRALDATAFAMKRTALSANELRFATRQLPAQMTDIFTSLASGQRPMQVLIQQGGQLKDVFGGVGPALRATVGYVRGLINPMTVAAAAAGALFLAWKEGSDEATDFNKALILTGNSSGTTAAKLAVLSEQLDSMAGVTQRSAAQALAAVAGSGEFTADQLEQVTRAALAMNDAVEKSIEDTIAEFAKLKDDPVDALLDLNEKQSFLTQAQLDNIRTLKAQGREIEAVTEAFRLYADTQESRAAEIVRNLSPVAKAWRGIKIALSEVVDELLNVGREGTFASKALTAVLLASPLGSTFTTLSGLGSKGAGKPDFSNVNSGPAVDSDAARAAIKEQEDAQKEFDRIRLSNLDKAAQLEREIANIRETGRKAGIAQSEIEKQVAAARARAAESTRRATSSRSRGTDPNDAARRELANLEKQVALLGQVAEGETKASNEARIRFEITQGAHQGASAALKQELIDQARLLDAGQRQVEIAKQLRSIDLEVLRLQGKDAAAALQEVIDKHRVLRADLVAKGQTDGVAKVDTFIDLTQKRAQIDAFQQQAQQAFDDIQRQQQAIQAEQQAGLITEYEAQQRIVDLYREKNAVLVEMLPTMEAIAQALGPDAVAAVARIRGEIERMAQSTNLLQQQVGATFQGAFANALTALATNTATLGEAVKGFLSDMTNGLARLAAQALAQAAWAKIISLFNKGTGSGLDQGADKLASAATTTAVAGGLVAVGANRLSGAAQELQTAAATLLAANLAGSGFGFAEGGYTGHGGKYQVAGVVHRGEGVLNQGEIRSLGGPRGFYALRDAIATGHLPRFAAIDAPTLPSMPAYNFADGGFAGAGLPAPQVNVGVYSVLDIEDLAGLFAESRNFQKSVVHAVVRNKDTIDAS